MNKNDRTGSFFWLVWVLIIFLTNGQSVSAASFKITTNADFIAAGAVLSGVLASDTDGNAAGYLRLKNTNPGMDDGNPALKFAGRGTWSKKRAIALTIPIDYNTAGAAVGRARRFAEKTTIDLSLIGNANTDWSDLRLTDWSGALVPFRLLDFERPTDNPETPVRLLFEADAHPSWPAASNTYYLYYGNSQAVSVENQNLSQFYIVNHDFERGLDGWYNCPRGYGMLSADGLLPSINNTNSNATHPLLAIENGLSVIPAGYTGFDSKACLSVGYPESTVYNDDIWRAVSQRITGPSSGTYVLSAQRRFSSASFTQGWYSLMFMQTTTAGRDRRYFVSSGFSDWMETTVDFTPNATRTVEIGLGMANSNPGGTNYRERRCNFDWAELSLKYPLLKNLGAEDAAGFLSVATYTSRVFDTGVANPSFGVLTWSANTTAPGTSVYFRTRTSANAGGPYSAWSSTITVNGDTITSPSARYIQIEAVLAAQDTSFSPVLDEVEIFYELPVTNFAVYAPSSPIAGEFFDFSVSAINQFGETVKDFSGLVSLSADSPNVELPKLSHNFMPFDNGIMVFQARNPVAETFRLIATFGAISSQSADIVTLPGATSKVEIRAIPVSVTAGQLFSFEIAALDRFGNVDASNNGLFNILNDDAAPGSFPRTVYAVNGIAPLTDCAFYTAPSRRVEAVEAVSGLRDFFDTTVVPGAATRLNVTAEPNQYQNVAFNLQIRAVDNFNNLDSSINTNVNLSLSNGLIAPDTGIMAAGIANLVTNIDSTGLITITGNTPTLLTGDLGLNVYPQPPPTLNRFLLDAGYDQLAGVPFTLTIEARDNSENILTSYDGACRIIPSTGQCSPPMTTGYRFIDGFMAIPITLSSADPNLILRVEDVKDNTKIGLLFLNVRPSGLSGFDVDVPASVVAGATFTFKITARDGQGNKLTNYTGTVNISHTATGGSTSLPANYTFSTADAGEKTFVGASGARFTRAEKVRLQVEDSGRVGVSNFVDILPDVTQPVLSVKPDMYTVFLGDSLSFNLSCKDVYENTLDGFTGTVNITCSEPTVVLPAAYTFQSFEDGFKRFLNEVNPANLGDFTITVTEPVSGAVGTTDLISVVSGETANFAFSPGGLTIPAGRQFSYVVTASNTAGDLNEQYNSAIRFSTLDSKALIPQDSTLVNGQGSFNSTFYTAGNFALSALDIQKPSISGAMNVTVIASTPKFIEFDILAPGFTTDAGVAVAYAIRVVDAFGNPASYTGNITVSSTDVKPTSTPTQVFAFANQSSMNALWTFTTAGTQRLRASAPSLSDGRSSPVKVLAGPARAITGDFPTAVSSELSVPFYVRIVDAYGNPTPLFTSQITVASTGSGFSGAPYTFSEADNGAHTFFLRWDRGTNAPQNMTVTFNRVPAASIPAPGAPLVLNVYLDNPKYNLGGGTYPFMNSWLSKPDRDVVASEPFRLMYRAFSIKETSASITSVIDFSLSDGDFLVSRDGVNYGKTISLTNESIVQFWAVVTRTGYLSMVASPRIAPRLAGTTNFIVQPGPVDRVTMLADSPQKAGVSFPWTVEWWDRNNNYARKTIETLDFTAIADGLGILDPALLILSGRTGRFNQSENNTWLTKDFIIASATANLKTDLMRQEISIQGIYDEDFSKGVLNFAGWQTLDFGNSNGSLSLDESQLKIWTTGNGTLSNHLSPSDDDTTDVNWYEDANDSYYYLYFDWPVNDIFAFDATIAVKRIWYDTTLDYSRCHIGIMMADSSHATRPRFVCSMLRRVDNSHASNREIGVFLGQAVYRNTPNGRRFRRKVATQASTVTTHPKWLRISRNGAGTFFPQLSPDGVNWQQLSQSPFSTAATNPAPAPNFTAATCKMGICVAAGNNTRPGMAWVDDFTINRFFQNASFTSVVYDVGTSTVTFTNPITIDATLNSGTLRFFARAGNNPATIDTLPWVERPLTWSGTQASINPTVFNSNRYFQYSLILGARVAGNNGGQTFYDSTPVVRSVEIRYNTGIQGANFIQRNVEPPAIIYASVTAAIFDGASVEIQGGNAVGLEITVPASVTAGVPFTASVRAVDAFGNTADDYDLTWAFTSSDSAPFAGVVPGDYTMVPAADSGMHTFHKAFVLFNGPSQTVQVSDGSLTTVSNAIVVNPGPVGMFSILAVSPQPANVVFPLSLEAFDIYGNTKSDHSGAIKFSDNKTGGLAVYSPLTIAASDWSSGLATLTPGVSFTKAETVKITGEGSNRSGVSNPIAITNASPAALLMTVSTNSPDSGIPFSVTVRALDNFGNIARDYVGQIEFSCNDAHPSVVLPSDYQFVAGDAGEKLFTSQFVFITPGPVMLQVVDTVNATMTHQFPLSVLPGPATRFDLSCNATQTAGVPFNLLIKVYDDYGNLKTNFSETISLLTGFDTVMPVSAGGFSNGQLLVPSVELNEAGLLPAENTIACKFGSVYGDRLVNLLPPSTLFERFDLETIPAEPTVGDAFKLVVKAVGPDGAVYTNYNSTGVFLEARDDLDQLVDPPMAPIQASGFTNGVKELYARNWVAGDITLWATDKVIPGKVGSLTVTFKPTNLSHFAVVPGTSTVEPFANNYYQTVNASFPLFLKAYDTIGNVKTDYSGIVQLSENGPGSLSSSTVVFVDGVATLSAVYYDQPGKIRITATDNILDRSGFSGTLQFFGPLHRFDVAANTHQTDETPFPVQLSAIDIYGQEKLNFSGNVTSQRLSWSLGPLTDVTLTPAAPAVAWEEAKSYTWLTANRPDAGTSPGDFGFRIISSTLPDASGSAIISLHRTSASTVTGLAIETFSPQQAGKPFPMLVKAVDASGAVVKAWAAADAALSALATLGFNSDIIPAAIAAAGFVDGVYATTTAQIALPGTYTVSVSSGGLSGSFSPLLVKPGAASALRITVPDYAPLNANFAMSVAAVTADGQIKTDFIPDGPILLKLNATSTGYLGVQFINPEDFVDGEAKILNQTYNKSQEIFISAIDNVSGMRDIGGPIKVFGPPVKLVLQPLPDAAADFFWNNWLKVRVTIKDVNGYPVANFTGDIGFSVAPGTGSLAADAAILPALVTQLFEADSLGSQEFYLKVTYSTLQSPTLLDIAATNAVYGLSGNADDLRFLKEPRFDSFEILSPADGGTVYKGKPFNFRVRAVDNFGNPWPLLASYPGILVENVDPLSLSSFNALPSGHLEFLNTSEVLVSGKVEYDDQTSAIVRYSVVPEDNLLAGDFVEFKISTGFNLKDSIYQKIATETFALPSRYILSAFISPGTGSAELKFTLINANGDPESSFGARINSDGTLLPIGSVAYAGKSEVLLDPSIANPDHQKWYRVYLAFDYQFDQNLASDTIIHLQNSTPAGFTASTTAYFDGIQLEKAFFADQVAPTAYSGSGIQIFSPNPGRSISGENDYFEW